MNIKCRLITEVGKRVYLRAYWGDKECKNVKGSGYDSYHNAMKPLYDISSEETVVMRHPNPGEFDKSQYPTNCEHCGAPVPDDATLQIFVERRYDNPEGRPQPGDMYWSSWYHEPEAKKALCKWDNCNDPRGHLLVILPNESTWDLMGRASNCTMKDDRLHRCWVVHGLDDLPNVHVDKNGHTCNAGAGSILSGNYHGFLHWGQLESI